MADAGVAPELSRLIDAGPGPGADTWVTLVRAERWAEAAIAIDASSDAGKSEPAVRLVRARAAMALGDFARALAMLDGLEAEMPSISDDIRRWRAEAQMETGAYAEAAAYFARQPGTKAIARAAVGFEKAGRAVDARAMSDKAISAPRADRDEVIARAVRARLSEQAGQKTAAVEDAKWIVIHAPASDEAVEAGKALGRFGAADTLTGKDHKEMAERLADAGLVDRALSELDLAAESPGAPPTADLTWARAFVLYKARNRYDQAAALFERIGAQPGPRQAEALFYAARAKSRGDRDDEALAGYRAVARRFAASPWAEQAGYLGARLSLLHAKWADAVTDYTAYLKKFPSGKERADATYERALCLFAGGQGAAARADLHGLAAAAGAVEAAHLRELEAVAALSSGDRDGAIALLSSVVRSQPLSWPALLARARLAREGAEVPPPIDPSDGRTSEPLAVKLPAVSDFYHRLGLDAEAETFLRAHEKEAAGNLRGREKEALCSLYGEIGRASRRYRVGLEALSPTGLGRGFSPATRWAWDCVFPRPYVDRVREIERRERIPKDLIFAVMRQESAFDPDAVSPARAVGLLQLMPDTARRIAAETGASFDAKLLRTAPVNLDLGGRYLAKMLATFGGSVPIAAAAYNAGPQAVGRWLARMRGIDLDVWVAMIPYEETRTYVSRVMGNLARYAYLDGGDQAVVPIDFALPEAKTDGSEY
jgi:soluble lytic murein transglycosylase